MDQKQFEAMLSDAESRLRRLKLLYDQWFMGFERTEPATLKKELDDLLGRLRKEQSNNTALRFRLQQLMQRYTTFTTHWRRIGRQIEEGTYQRDVIRAKRMKSRGDQDRDSGAETELSYDVDLDIEIGSALDDAERAADAALSDAAPAVAAALAAAALAAAPAKPGLAAPAIAPKTAQVRAPAPAGVVPAAARSAGAVPAPAAAKVAASVAAAPAAARPAGPRSLSPFAMPSPAKPSAEKPAAMPGNGAPAAAKIAPAAAAKPAAPAAANTNAAAAGAFSRDDVQRVYTQYIAARQKNSERTDNVRPDTIEKTIRTMLPQLEKKHAGKKIDFEVVVKDGKVALKPVAR